MEAGKERDTLGDRSRKRNLSELAWPTSKGFYIRTRHGNTNTLHLRMLFQNEGREAFLEAVRKSVPTTSRNYEAWTKRYPSARHLFKRPEVFRAIKHIIATIETTHPKHAFKVGCFRASGGKGSHHRRRQSQIPASEKGVRIPADFTIPFSQYK